MNKITLFIDYNNLFVDLDKAYDNWEDDEETLVEMAIHLLNSFDYGKRYFCNLDISFYVTFSEYIADGISLCRYL